MKNKSKMEWNNNYDDGIFFSEWKVSEEDENENDFIDTSKKEVKGEAKDASRYVKSRSRNIRKEMRDDFRDLEKCLKYSDNPRAEENLKSTRKEERDLDKYPKDSVGSSVENIKREAKEL